MEIAFNNRKNIEIKNKTISKLDKFVFEITNIIKKYTNYVVVSGYVAILFGRSRVTEDIDILIKPITLDTFERFLKEIEREFWIIDPGNTNMLFHMLKDSLAIRIARKNEIFPNAEVKFAQKIIDKETLDNSIEVIINDEKKIYIAPLELQIAYKLFLGSDKDILDAIYLYELLKNYIDKKEIDHWTSYLGVDQELLKKLISGSENEK